jgi:hypothetical protein
MSDTPYTAEELEELKGSRLSHPAHIAGRHTRTL